MLFYHPAPWIYILKSDTVAASMETVTECPQMYTTATTTELHLINEDPPLDPPDFSTCYEDINSMKQRSKGTPVRGVTRSQSNKLSVFDSVVKPLRPTPPPASSPNNSISPLSSCESLPRSPQERNRSVLVQRRTSNKTVVGDQRQRRPVSIALPDQRELSIMSPSKSSPLAETAPPRGNLIRNTSKGSSMNRKSRTAILEGEQLKNVKRRKSFFQVNSSPSLQNVIVRYRQNKVPSAATNGQKDEKKSRRLSLPNFFGYNNSGGPSPTGTGGFSVIKNVLLNGNANHQQAAPYESTPDLVHPGGGGRRNRKSSVSSMTSNGSFKPGFIFSRRGKDRDEAR